MLLNKLGALLFSFRHVVVVEKRAIMSACVSQQKLAGRNGLVAVCQLTPTSDKEKNFETCKKLIERSAAGGAKVVFLPETFDFVGSSTEESKSLAEPLDGDLVSRYQKLACSLRVWLSLGGFHEKGSKDDARLRNTHILINSDGNVAATYNKTHLFHYENNAGISLKESKWVKPGSYVVPPVATPVGKVGMAICYDLRFPQLSTALAQLGAEILTYPSNFTVPTGLAHWEVLLRSRAIENQCYVIAAATVGQHNEKRQSYGHSMVVDPWGTVIAQCRDGTSVCFADIDLDYLREVRSQMPVMSHRRHDLYGTITPITRAPTIDDPDTYAFGQHSISSSVVFYKSAHCIAFVNRKPVVPGHVLVSTIRVVNRFSELAPEEVSDMFLVTQTVSKAIERHHEASALSVAVQDGADAGQTVQHVHVHILPRKPGDFAENDTIYDELASHDKDEKGRELPAGSSKFRTAEDMAAEASILRELFT